MVHTAWAIYGAYSKAVCIEDGPEKVEKQLRLSSFRLTTWGDLRHGRMATYCFGEKKARWSHTS